MKRPHNPITWQGMADLTKRVAAVIVAAGVIGGAWVAMGGPVPASQANLDRFKAEIETSQQRDERFMQDTRRLLLIMQKNSVLTQLAELHDREAEGERSRDLRRMKLSLEREISSLERQLSKLKVLNP